MGRDGASRRSRAGRKRRRSGWRALGGASETVEGSRPDALRIPPQSPPPRITLVRYSADRVEERQIDSVEQLPVPASRPGTVEWIDIQGMGDESAMRKLGEKLGLHPLALADIVNVPQRPKVEDFQERLLIITRMAQLDERREVFFEQVSLVLAPGWLLTVQEDPGDVFDPVRERIRGGVGLIRRKGADYLAYALIDAVVDAYYGVVERIGEEVDALEDLVLGRPEVSVVRRIHALRRTLLTLHRIQWRQRDALASLVRDQKACISAEVIPFLRDAHDHCVQMLDVTETTRELVTSLMEIYVSVVGNRMNEIMKTLTVIATIFIPLTFIVGVYGMNFDYMPELRWRFGYFAIWGVMLTLALSLLGWFYARGWIGRAPSPAAEPEPDLPREPSGPPAT
jgi:magnesium transporter